MTRTLDHLPAGKRAELTFVVDVLRSAFDEERSTRQSPALRDGVILKILLFGSYARGDWVSAMPTGRPQTIVDGVRIRDIKVAIGAGDATRLLTRVEAAERGEPYRDMTAPG